MINFFSNKRFLKTLAFLAVPIMLNELLNSAVNMLDTFMVGTLGDAPVAAVGLGNQVFFLFILLSFGINSGTAIFMGQYAGKNDMPNVHKTIGLSLVLTLAASVMFALAAYFMPDVIMRIYSKDEVVISLGSGYLKTVAVSYIFTAVIVVFNSALKVTGNTIQPMATTFIAFIINMVCNYIFIFKMGYGVKGSAMGTVCARACELVIQFIIMIKCKRKVLARPAAYFGFNFGFCKNIIPVALPVICNEALWSLGTTGYNIAYKYSGTLAQAAVQIATTVQNLFMVAGMGIGSACAIILSNTLGAGDKEKALDYSKRCVFFGTLISSIMGIILALSAGSIVGIFKVDPIAGLYAHRMLLIVAVGVVVKTLSYITICGILRSGGDTRYCLVLEGLSVWFIGLPMAFLGSAILHLPIYITFAMVYMEEVIKVIISFHRVAGNKWLRTLV